MSATHPEPEPDAPVAETATVGGVPQKRGLITDADKRKIAAVKAKRDAIESEWRAVVLIAVEHGASVRELAAFTGLSTNTISRWKRGE